MKLEVDEFIRRFLLHILPAGFFKVRYYGMFSSRYRKANIATAKKHLKQEQDTRLQERREDGSITTLLKQDTVWNEILQSIQQVKKYNCPKCHKGRLCFAGLTPG